LDEVNIFGEGRRDGQQISIVGEAKSRLKTKHVDVLVQKVERLQASGILYKDYLLVVVVHSVRPVVEEYARAQGVKVYWSFELAGARHF
jgi:hypothetical protein